MKKIENIVKVLPVLTILLLAQSCSFLGLDEVFKDRSNLYRLSEETDTIDVPENLDAQTVGELYPVPEGGEVVSYQLETAFKVPRPKPVAVNSGASKVKIQKLGQEQWILISASPSEAWPRIRGYLTRNGIPTRRAYSNKGIIETGLVKFKDDDQDDQHQFKIILTQGVQENTTEVLLIHRNLPSNIDSNALPEWSSQFNDQKREDWLRKDLANALALEDLYGTASLLGQAISTQSRVVLTTPTEGLSVLEMRMPMNRAWASVSYALASEGFEIIESNKETREFTIEHRPLNFKKKSWFKKIVTISGESKAKKYQLHLQQLEGVIEIRLKGLDGKELTQRKNYNMLLQVRNNLA